MPHFRKKPIVIEAMQVPGPDEFEAWGHLSVFLGAWRTRMVCQ